MGAKCAICKRAFVSTPGEICITCKMRQQPYQTEQMYRNRTQSHQSASDPVQWDNTEGKKAETTALQETQQRQTVEKTAHSYTGIVQNIHQSDRKNGFLQRWFQSVCYGNPLIFSDRQYEFTLYLEGNYSAEKVQGREVVFYGESDYSFLNNNSTVQIHGVTDRNGVVIADEIRGINTSFRMKPKFAVSGAVVRILSFMALLCVVAAVVAVATTQEALCEEQFNIVNFLVGAICILAAWFVIKRRYPQRFLIAAVLVAVGSIAVFPTLGYAILCVLAVIFLVKKFLKIH